MEIGKGGFSNLRITAIRPLTRDDLPTLARPRAKHAAINKLRDPHHRLARFLAAGMTNTDAALASGYSLNRVQILLQDPTFNNLVDGYRAEVTQAFFENLDHYHDLATRNMVVAERMIAERLEEADTDPEAKPIPIKDLLTVSRDAADRFGYGKKETRVNVNVDFASRLEKARQRSARVVEIAREGAVAALPPSAGGESGPLAPQALPQPLRRRA